MYLAVSGLSCSRQGLLLRQPDSLVVACGFSSCSVQVLVTPRHVGT